MQKNCLRRTIFEQRLWSKFCTSIEEQLHFAFRSFKMQWRWNMEFSYNISHKIISVENHFEVWTRNPTYNFFSPFFFCSFHPSQARRWSRNSPPACPHIASVTTAAHPRIDTSHCDLVVKRGTNRKYYSISQKLVFNP